MNIITCVRNYLNKIMTVKELFQSLKFKDIAETLKEQYGHNGDSLLPITEYKENYIIILQTRFFGKGGSITFKEDGDSDVYMIEGDSYDNIVGMEVINLSQKIY